LCAAGIGSGLGAMTVPAQASNGKVKLKSVGIGRNGKAVPVEASLVGAGRYFPYNAVAR
jgi:hypothetical protein